MWYKVIEGQNVNGSPPPPLHELIWSRYHYDIVSNIIGNYIAANVTIYGYFSDAKQQYAIYWLPYIANIQH